MGAQQMKLVVAGVDFFGLLGIHYDQFPEAWPIIGKVGEMPPVKHDGPVIRGLSGMTKVLPACPSRGVEYAYSEKEAR